MLSTFLLLIVSWSLHASVVHQCALDIAITHRNCFRSQVLEGDVKALAESTALPFRGMKRQTSAMTKLPSMGRPQLAPRDHA